MSEKSSSEMLVRQLVTMLDAIACTAIEGSSCKKQDACLDPGRVREFRERSREIGDRRMISRLEGYPHLGLALNRCR